MPVQTQKEVWVRTGQPRYRWFVIFRGGTSRFGCLRGLLCGTSAPVRGWVIESGSLAGNVSASASSRFASSSAFCALVLAFLFMGTMELLHFAICNQLRIAVTRGPVAKKRDGALSGLRLRTGFGQCGGQRAVAEVSDRLPDDLTRLIDDETEPSALAKERQPMSPRVLISAS